MKLFTVVGARPQFIKAAAVSRAIALRDDVHETIIHTGQHYDANMSDVFFEDLGIPRPTYNLGIGGGTHGKMTARQLEAIEAVLLNDRPDAVLVYGDTNSTLAGALAAAKLHIPVAHVEAGLRSLNRKMPEETNRILTDHLAELLFAPTLTAVKNLSQEGIHEDRVYLVGDVMYDAAKFYGSRAKQPLWFDSLCLRNNDFILATIHRAENTEYPERLSSIIAGLGDVDRPVVLPLHPRTRDKLDLYGIRPANNILFVDPVGYLEMVWLEMKCDVVATDSGGVQKEAFFHGKPCVTFRDETEWTELVDLGANFLVGANRRAIVSALSGEYPQTSACSVYGDGNAASKIVDKMASILI